jgi:hypothetical protein
MTVTFTMTDWSVMVLVIGGLVLMGLMVLHLWQRRHD